MSTSSPPTCPHAAMDSVTMFNPCDGISPSIRYRCAVWLAVSGHRADVEPKLTMSIPFSSSVIFPHMLPIILTSRYHAECGGSSFVNACAEEDGRRLSEPRCGKVCGHLPV